MKCPWCGRELVLKEKMTYLHPLTSHCHLLAMEAPESWWKVQAEEAQNDKDDEEEKLAEEYAEELYPS
jgi:hypothetical protein